MNESLTDRAQRLLAASDLSLREIDRATGLSRSWLSWFQRTKPTDPGVGRVERLIRFLEAQAHRDDAAA